VLGRAGTNRGARDDNYGNIERDGVLTPEQSSRMRRNMGLVYAMKAALNEGDKK